MYIFHTSKTTSFLIAFSVFSACIVLTLHPAFAATTKGGITAPGSLSSLLAGLGIKTVFSFQNVLAFTIKPVAAYLIAHGFFDAHAQWKRAEYKNSELLHSLLTAGGTTILIGGAGFVASNILQGSGALLPH